MAIERKLARVYTAEPHPGFLGRGHIARHVIAGDYAQSDPFILLMDDLLDKQDDAPAGGPHPHAGFETVTLLLEGEIGDENHMMKKGDFQLMTAGSGIIHTETIEKKTKMQLLQLWLNLPKKNRSATPRVQDLAADHVPSLVKDGLSIKVYSGHIGGITSPIQNYVPLIVADIQMEPGTSTVQEIPAHFNSFLYVLRGSLKVGKDGQPLQKNEVGWLTLTADETQSELRLVAGDSGARFVLYAGKPLGENIVSHGPFIADSSEDIIRLYREYREGKMKHISTVPESQRIML